MKNNKELMSNFVLRRVVCFLLFPAVLLPCGVVFLLGFLFFFHVSHDFFSVSVLSWTIFVLVFLWLISLVTLLFCLAVSFLQTQEKDDNDFIDRDHELQ
ncbi:MAG: hypothetical protein LBH59_11400 [Planctomycetaceae bacterium]|nr:hypothetical protein [Planctomycetaceae bacterium]